jgi:hypothetical protein
MSLGDISLLLIGEMPHSDPPAHYTVRQMSNRTDYFKSMNSKTPIMPVRLPSRWHHDQVKTLAAEDGVTLSEWVRTLIGREVEARTISAPS